MVSKSLSGKRDFVTQYCGEDYFDVFYEGVVAVVITVQADFVWIDDSVVIPYSQFLIRHLLIALRQSEAQVIVIVIVAEGVSLAKPHGSKPISPSLAGEAPKR